MKAICAISLMAASAALLALSAPARASKMDTRIEAAAKQSYVFRTYFTGDDIKIESRDGAVTLTGSVAENSRKSLAQETVAYLPGVKSVDNRLVVTGAPTANSDAWLSDKVKITLLFHRGVNVGKAEVGVKDGTVTLRGVADSQAQKESTAEYARDIDGVKEVINEMTVSETPEKTPRTADEIIDDASVTAQVKMALLLHRSTSVLSTSVTTKKGVVTLGGKARNIAEKNLVTRLVTDINGVKRVKNQMAVE
ncbi:MAG: BON domain-containing protein [Elusimicrobiota bacterium]|nr:BON domain-containing protein [Elusimicrobiota bacterium]